jgi:hypothetical protein
MGEQPMTTTPSGMRVLNMEAGRAKCRYSLNELFWQQTVCAWLYKRERKQGGQETYHDEESQNAYQVLWPTPTPVMGEH